MPAHGVLGLGGVVCRPARQVSVPASVVCGLARGMKGQAGGDKDQLERPEVKLEI